VALRRREVELSVDRPLDPGNPSAGSVRLSARFEPGEGDASGPSHADLMDALEGLRQDLDAMVGPPLAGLVGARPDRDLDELVETYRPRQRELVDALRDDGELTRGEHEQLVAYLGGAGSRPIPAMPQPEPSFDRPIAAAPISAGRSVSSARPVPELLRQYQIASLKQAGAVRARRQISFEEYMALKRHFQREDVADPRSTE